VEGVPTEISEGKEQEVLENNADVPAELTIAEELENLKAEVDEYRAQADENLDGWQRALADFANYKKRVERDHVATYQNTVGQVVRKYLEVLDDLELALNNRPLEGEGAIWSEGIELIYRKVKGIVEAEGVVPMDIQGALFDPNHHEAISLEVSPDHESGQIIEVVKTGYMLGDRVLRPASVRVAQ
jgi:molecular chaperone GrpE